MGSCEWTSYLARCLLAFSFQCFSVVLFLSRDSRGRISNSLWTSSDSKVLQMLKLDNFSNSNNLKQVFNNNLSLASNNNLNLVFNSNLSQVFNSNLNQVFSSNHNQVSPLSNKEGFLNNLNPDNSSSSHNNSCLQDLRSFLMFRSMDKIQVEL